MSHVGIYEAELGLPSGIGAMRADDCQIDPEVFSEFVGALLDPSEDEPESWPGRLGQQSLASLTALVRRLGRLPVLLWGVLGQSSSLSASSSSPSSA
ncbi:DUF6086 family protein [Streptomyces sp. NPDC087300]|uniref:DUF6086 family protein n=1 Tax=Streptomyces sp. NPDC087300 TaxID=3365780 RepID=UPI00381D617B